MFSIYRKKIRANNCQTEHIINFMARNREFALGIFASANGLQRQNAQWQILARELAEIGPAKTVDQWKTVSILSLLLSTFLGNWLL